MELTIEEKDTINKVSAITKLDKKIVENVFKGLLIATDMNLYKNCNYIVVPYLTRLGIRYRKVRMEDNKEGTEVRLDPIASDFLYSEVDKILNLKETSVEEYLNKRIQALLKKKLNEKINE